MAFAYAISGGTIFGNKRIKFGTFTNGVGDSGGAIVTGLNKVDFINFAISSGISEFPPNISSNTAGTVTIATSNGTDGTWFAFGL
jgi:hypothetical protein